MFAQGSPAPVAGNSTKFHLTGLPNAMRVHRDVVALMVLYGVLFSALYNAASTPMFDMRIVLC